MPLPPLEEHNTPRYFLDYEGPMGKRVIQLRVNPADAGPSAVTAVQQLVQLLRDLVYTSVTFNGLRYAAAGTNVSNPVLWTPVQGTQAGVIDGARYPRYMSFVGRGPDGRRIRFSVYGVTGFPDNDYRTLPGEFAPVAAVLNYLNNDTNPFRTISGSVPVWKQYANQGFNAYYQRKRRLQG